MSMLFSFVVRLCCRNLLHVKVLSYRFLCRHMCNAIKCLKIQNLEVLYTSMCCSLNCMIQMVTLKPVPQSFYLSEKVMLLKCFNFIRLHHRFRQNSNTFFLTIDSKLTPFKLPQYCGSFFPCNLILCMKPSVNLYFSITHTEAYVP